MKFLVGTVAVILLGAVASVVAVVVSALNVDSAMFYE